MGKNKSKKRLEQLAQKNQPPKQAAPVVKMQPPAPKYIFRTRFARDDGFSNFVKSVFAYTFQPIILGILIVISYILNREVKFLKIKQRILTPEEVAEKRAAQEKLIKQQAEISESIRSAAEKKVKETKEEKKSSTIPIPQETPDAKTKDENATEDTKEDTPEPNPDDKNEKS